MMFAFKLLTGKALTAAIQCTRWDNQQKTWISRYYNFFLTKNIGPEHMFHSIKYSSNSQLLRFSGCVFAVGIFAGFAVPSCAQAQAAFVPDFVLAHLQWPSYRSPNLNTPGATSLNHVQVNKKIYSPVAAHSEWLVGRQLEFFFQPRLPLPLSNFMSLRGLDVEVVISALPPRSHWVLFLTARGCRDEPPHPLRYLKKPCKIRFQGESLA